jgi:hypothetical protein
MINLLGIPETDSLRREKPASHHCERKSNKRMTRQKPRTVPAPASSLRGVARFL